jgi:hypothetical protein
MTNHYPATELKAPAGTKPHTPWIWLIVVLPLLPMLALMTIDWSSLIDLSDPTGQSAFALYAHPAYWLATLGGWVSYGLCAWFAYLDWRELGRRGVPQPFHFAWVFLSGVVYVIGRSVVVRRRTGEGIAPMWAAIGTMVLGLGMGIYVTVAVMAPLFEQLATIPVNAT